MKKLCLIFILYIYAFQCFGGSELVGTTNANFVKIPPFARAAGMGEAFAAVSDGTYGLYYNPAGLTSTLGYEIQATHISWFQNINYEFLAFVAPFPLVETGKLGFALSWFQIDEMANTSALPSYDETFLNSNVDLNDYINGYFRPFDYSLITSYAFEAIENMSAGFTIKVNSQNIDTYSGIGISGDIGIIYRGNFMDSFVRLGAVVSNLGTQIKMEDEGYDAPIIVKAGISDRFSLFDNYMLVAAQAIIQADYESIYSLGAEYWIADVFAFRAGYKTGAFEHPTFGAGLRLSQFELNYAYIQYKELGATHRISALYSWGAPPVRLRAYPYVFSPNNDRYADYTNFIPKLEVPEQLTALKINIYDSSGLVKLTSIENIKPSETKIPWKGSAGSKVLADGNYLADIEADYGGTVSISEKIPVEIDNTPPDMQINAEPKILNPGKTDSLVIPATFTFYAKDKNSVAEWKFLIWDEFGKLYFDTSGKGEPPLSYIWDGRGNNGEYVHTGDIYYYSFVSMDRLGNKAKTPPQSQVVLLKEIRLTFSSDALFEIGQAHVKISAYHIMKTMKTVIDKYPDSNIVVEGYTDNVPTSGTKYKNNTELSKARADAVKFFMVNLLGMDEKRISTVGYGELNPITTNDTREGRAKNRRVEIKIESTIYK